MMIWRRYQPSKWSTGCLTVALTSRQPSARSAFSDPRTEAIQGQIREAETVQAIARLRLVRADYQKRIFLLSNLPVEMPVDHLIGFNNLMPDKLEMELIKRGDIPLTPLGLEKMRPDLGYSGASARMLFQPDRSKASNPKSLLFYAPHISQNQHHDSHVQSG